VNSLFIRDEMVVPTPTISQLFDQSAADV